MILSNHILLGTLVLIKINAKFSRIAFTTKRFDTVFIRDDL